MTDDMIDSLAEQREALEVKLAKAVEALRRIAKQKRTDELDTEYDVECADFETGYDECINCARAALAEIKGESHE